MALLRLTPQCADTDTTAVTADGRTPRPGSRGVAAEVAAVFTTQKQLEAEAKHLQSSLQKYTKL